MKPKIIFFLFMTSAALISCNSGSSSSSSNTPSAQAIPGSYVCLPSSLPTNSGSSVKIAYAGNCAVESALQSKSLQSMAVALEKYSLQDDSNPESAFYNNCTGTPIQTNLQTGISFILTAAHCVTGTSSPKPAGLPTTASNINTYVESDAHNQAWIYQGVNAGPLQVGDMTAEILAVYVPSQYCQSVAYTDIDGDGEYTCSGVGGRDIPYMNGDFAILKVKTLPNKTLSVATNLKLAPSDFSLNSGVSNLLVLGYGGTNPNGTVESQNPNNTQLNYINTQYFGTNSYAGTSASITIMNGYLVNGTYYSLICGGDSGGGDFAWDGSSWNLVGVHSWGASGYPLRCGLYSSFYGYASNVSADVRQFNNWIQTVLTKDTQITGCANLGSEYACISGSGI